MAVTSSDSACEVMPTQAPAGTVVFSVQNTGGRTTEFYLLRDNDRVVAEVENIGPGVARDLVVDVEAGITSPHYKPGADRRRHPRRLQCRRPVTRRRGSRP